MAWEGQDALDQRRPDRQVTALGEKGRERLGRHGNDEIRDGKLASRLGVRIGRIRNTGSTRRAALSLCNQGNSVVVVSDRVARRNAEGAD